MFQAITDFAVGVEEDTGNRLNISKCKGYSPGQDWEALKWIPGYPTGLKEGSRIGPDGDVCKGIKVFNVPLGEPRFVEAVLAEKAKQVDDVATLYVEDIGRRVRSGVVEYDLIQSAAQDHLLAAEYDPR